MKKTDETEKIIEAYLPKEDGLQKTILLACNYSVRAGGKRLRPMLMKETYELFGGSESVIEPFMAAIEMIHSSSLVHDDLPCMDNDEYRRGKLTTWKAFEQTAYPEKVGKAIAVLAKKTGISGMIGGQTVDVELSGKPMNEKQLDFVYRLKTGALIEASMMIGAILAGASEEEIAQAERIAEAVGMAFQIQDDILDLTSTTEKLGKPVKSDEKNNKTTYVTLNGMEQSKKDVESISIKAVKELRELPGNNQFLEDLIQILVTRES